jgi:hypothetical protein
VAGRTIQFDASSSNVTNPAATITSYSWDWGTGGFATTPRPNATYQYPAGDAGGLLTITLTVTDSYGIQGSRLFLIRVIRIWTDLVISSVVADPSLRVLPGTQVTVTVSLQNQSINPVNASVITSVGTNSLGTTTFMNLAPNRAVTFSLTWNTQGLRPRVYLVEALAPPIVNSTTGQIIQNETSNNVAWTLVQIVEPLPPGFGVLLGLGLLPAAGVGIVVLAGAGGVISLLKGRKKLRPTFGG